MNATRCLQPGCFCTLFISVFTHAPIFEDVLAHADADPAPPPDTHAVADAATLARATTPIQRLYALWQPEDVPWQEWQAYDTLKALGIDPYSAVAGCEAAVAEAYSKLRGTRP